MAVRIRLSLRGCLNRPFYHIVVANSKRKRDGKHFEQVGCYDPMPNSKGEIVVGLNVERIKYWLSVGATPTVPVYKLLGLSGMLPVHPRLYFEASRARAKSAAAREAAGATESADKDESTSGQSSVDNKDTSSQDNKESTPS